MGRLGLKCKFTIKMGKTKELESNLESSSYVSVLRQNNQNRKLRLRATFPKVGSIQKASLKQSKFVISRIISISIRVSKEITRKVRGKQEDRSSKEKESKRTRFQKPDGWPVIRTLQSDSNSN